VVPGDPSKHPHTYILPVMLVGIPALLLFVVTIWAVPLALLGLVTTALSGRWSTLAAVASLVLYFAAVTVGLGLLRRGVLSLRRRPAAS